MDLFRTTFLLSVVVGTLLFDSLLASADSGALSLFNSSFTKADSLAVSGDLGCLIADGRVMCWGENSRGMLGRESTHKCAQGDDLVPCSPRPGPVASLDSGATAISTSGGHTCVLKEGHVYCWGSNSWGQLGFLSNDGKTWSDTYSSVPKLVPNLLDVTSITTESTCV